MKDRKAINGLSSSSPSSSTSSTTTANANFNVLLRGIQEAIIRKNNNGGGGNGSNDLQLLRRRLKEYFLYSKLKSLIPPPQPFDVQMGIRHDNDGGSHEELATEVDMELNEIPAERDSDHEEIDHHNELAANNISSSIIRTDNLVRDIEEANQHESEDEDENEHTIVEFESEDDDDDGSVSLRPFAPSVKINTMAESTILISTIVLKEVALTSTLFRILEDEKLDIVSENQYRTETKVAHTIQVKVEPEYKIDELEKMLQKWAEGSW